jgi:hypothetical protein
LVSHDNLANKICLPIILDNEFNFFIRLMTFISKNEKVKNERATIVTTSMVTREIWVQCV